MAVTKMEKVTVISDKTHQESVLQTLQGLQNVEIRDLSKSTENNAWVQKYFSGSFDQMLETREAEFEELERDYLEAMQFIEHHGNQKKQKDEKLKRQYISLQEMEAVFDEQKFRRDLTEILNLKSQWSKIQDRKNELLRAEDWLTTWRHLDVNPNAVSSKYIAFLSVTVSSGKVEAFLNDLKQTGLTYAEEIFSGEKDSQIALIYHNSMADTIQDIIGRYSVQIESYPYDLPPKEMLENTKEHLKEANKELKSLSQGIGEKRSLIKNLQWADEVISAMKVREHVKNELVQSRYLIVLQGWVGVQDKEELLAALTKSLGENEVYIDFENPTDYEIQTEVPTKLNNNSLVQPFEMLTEMYSLPKYDEIDPTPWFVPFYLVFFGMMVADIGYGLLMLIATTIALKVMVLPRGMMRFAKFFQILSIPTIVWGIIYGSIFGMSTPFEPLLSTNDDIIQILALSVVFGFIQIMVGLFIAAKEHLKRKEYLDSIGDGFAWQGILLGIVVGAGGSMFLNNQTLSTIGYGISIVSALCIVAVPIIQSSSKIAGAASGLYNLYGLTGYIGDLVSYTRLMALGISGGSIAAAFNLLVGYMPAVARYSVGILLIIALHALNLFLSLLSAYVHGARLQFVEFFGKFYSGGGKKFEPLKTAEKYVNIETKKVENNGGFMKNDGLSD